MRTCAACALVLIHLVACGRGEPAKPAASPSPTVTKTEPPVAPAGAAEPQPAQPTKPKVAPAPAASAQAARAQEAKAAAQPPQPATPTAQAAPSLPVAPPQAPRTEAKPPAAPPPAAPKPAAPKPPGIVVFPASFGKVTFDHPGHGKRNACAACHKTDPPAKIVLAKDSAHALCKGCHEQKAAGPTKCIGCHVK